jgi:hypothetical protein
MKEAHPFDRDIKEIPVGFVYAHKGHCYVLNRDEAAMKEEFVPAGAVHTATVALDIVLERILNKEDGVKRQLNEMRGIA